MQTGSQRDAYEHANDNLRDTSRGRRENNEPSLVSDDGGGMPGSGGSCGFDLRTVPLVGRGPEAFHTFMVPPDLHPK